MESQAKVANFWKFFDNIKKGNFRRLFAKKVNKNLTIAFYVIYLIITIILSFIFMKDTEKESSGIVFGDDTKDIKAGVENKF